MPDAILTLNAGSSSIKVALFEIGEDGELSQAFGGQIEGIGTAPHFKVRDPHGKILADQHWEEGSHSYDDCLGDVLTFAEQHLGDDVLCGVGHRVVHGGRDHVAPERVAPPLIDALEALVPLAPLHQPHNIAPMQALLRLRPDLPQVACFDTAFHHTMPRVATRFALPIDVEQHGVRRYGFHGLSYAFIAGQLRTVAPDLAHGPCHRGSSRQWREPLRDPRLQ